MIDAAAVRAFTGGQCHALAMALAERTGWPVIAALDDDGDSNHFFVTTPDGRALDITGCHDMDEFCDEWGGWAEAADADEVEDAWINGNMREPDLTAARAYVSEVLRYVDGTRPAFCDPGYEGMEDLPEVPVRAPSRMLVAAGDGERVEIKPGELTDAARELFRTRQDHALARVLCYASDLPSGEIGIGVLIDADSGELTHCYGRLPDGRVIDIDGVHELAELKARYGGEPQRVGFKQLNALLDEDDRPHADDTAAETFLPGLLAQLT